MQDLTVADYINFPELKIPYKHSQKNLEITKVAGICNGCGKKTEKLRGKITEYENCIDVNFGGICKPCMLVTFARFRFYNWGWLHLSDRGWVEYEFQPLWKRILFGIIKLLGC